MLERAPVDRVPVFESFWGDTTALWRSQGLLGKDQSPDDHFDLDLRLAWVLNTTANLDHADELVEETPETKLVRNGNGALLRWWKAKSGTPEHVDFMVKDRQAWEEHIKPRLKNASDYERRINFDAYRNARQAAARQNKFFVYGGVNVFELMHPVCGHEHMLMGMAMDPDWVRDMCQTYAQLVMDLLDMLFDREGRPDGIWYYEDMGFKERPFMSPAMYKDIVWPSHKGTFDHAHAMGLKVIVHSCGFVEPLVPGLIEAGMDCLQAMEVKAGMDLLRLKQSFGHRIAFMGGMDIRTLETNDLAAVDRELAAKLPGALAGGGYCLHTDHSIPVSVKYETYKHFIRRGIELSRS
jgi:uroporphyrinogen decarboxylase